MDQTSKIGDSILVRCGDQVIISGRVKFASKSFITIDEGSGVVAILRLDVNMSQPVWRMGKVPVWFTTGATFSERLNKIYQLALEVL